MKVIGIIPARLGSSRLTNKPLIQVTNKTLIQLTYEAVQNSGLFDSIFITTDSNTIKNHTKNFGAKCILTSQENRNGTERCIELIEKLQYKIDDNTLIINIQCDGDLNYTPGSLWTAAHHKLPVLTIMHNNRGYHQEVMYLHYMAGVRGRGTDRMHIGTTLRDPFIDYAKLAEAYGMNSEGPIENPDDLKAAFSRGIRSVLDGEPYLIDVITEPR